MRGSPGHAARVDRWVPPFNFTCSGCGASVALSEHTLLGRIIEESSGNWGAGGNWSTKDWFIDAVGTKVKPLTPEQAKGRKEGFYFNDPVMDPSAASGPEGKLSFYMSGNFTNLSPDAAGTLTLGWGRYFPCAPPLCKSPVRNCTFALPIDDSS